MTAGQPTGIVITYNKTSKAETISGANLTGVNFSGSVCTKCTSGTVALTDGTPVAGVSVSASNASATRWKGWGHPLVGPCQQADFHLGGLCS